jgi:hypothetical protein
MTDLSRMPSLELEAARAALLRERSQLDQRRRVIAEELAPLTAELIRRARVAEAERKGGAR